MLDTGRSQRAGGVPPPSRLPVTRDANLKVTRVEGQGFRSHPAQHSLWDSLLSQQPDTSSGLGQRAKQPQAGQD